MLSKEEYILDFKKKTSFIFTGHNIKWFAVLAIETLIKNCEIPRENVYFFDDKSTDGSKEELEKRGVHVITWDPILYRNFRFCRLSGDLCVRVDQIIASAAKQITSEYACYLDGDTAYRSDAIAQLIEQFYDEELRSGTKPDICGILRDYAAEDVTYEKIKRNIWQNYMYVDVAKANENGILKNSLSNILTYRRDAPLMEFGNAYDTGVEVYNNLEQSTLKKIYHSQDEQWYDDLMEKTIHLGWLSSSMRDDKLYAGNWEETFEKIKKNIEKFGVKDLCTEVNLDYGTVLQSFADNFRKTDAMQ